MKIFTILLTYLSLISCNNSNQIEEPWTTSEDNIHFINERFKLSITKPENWYVPNGKELVALKQGSKDSISDDDGNFRAESETALETVLTLFAFHEFTPGTQTKTNSSLMGLAVNISSLKNIKNGCDYLYYVKKGNTHNNLNFDPDFDCNIQVINGIEMSYVNSQMDVRGDVVKQKFMACLSGEHAILVAYNILNKDNSLEIDNVLNTLKVQCES